MKRYRISTIPGIWIAIVLICCHAQNYSLVNQDEILSGGVSKDQIPAIDRPLFDSTENTPFDNDELVVGIVNGNEAKAYPYAILDYHEIVNDYIGNVPVAVTLCPLCDTTPVFIRKIYDKTTTFGVSGKLFHSCLVMYDRLSDTMWSQPWGIGIQGLYVNYPLEKYPASVTTLGRWKHRYPSTKVLSPNGDYRRGDYSIYPYGDYRESSRLLRFPVKHQQRLADQGIHNKEIVQYIAVPNPLQPVFNEFGGNSYAIRRSSMATKAAQGNSDGTYFTIGSNYRVLAKWDQQMGVINFYNVSDNGGGNNLIPSSTSFAFVYVSLFNEQIH